jgi:hypothetical protein
MADQFEGPFLGGPLFPRSFYAEIGREITILEAFLLLDFLPQ